MFTNAVEAFKDCRSIIMTPISDHKMVTFSINDTIGEHREFENNIILEISKYNFNNRDHVKMRAALKETNWDQQGIFLTYVVLDYRMLPPFAKIMQSFILMQNL